ncbi:MAG: hypothetical protein ABW125_19410, partial [Candidatus Thiodiazotropha lotti]
NRLKESISMNLQRVTYVSEHLLPLTPVYTPIKGEGLLCISLANLELAESRGFKYKFAMLCGDERSFAD